MAGLLYDPQSAKEQALYSGLLGLGAQLLANSGRRYSTTPGGPGLGAALGQGLLGFQQGADSSMRDSMRGALFGMQMDQAQQEKTRQKAYEDMLFKMANPANPGQAAMGIDGAMGNTARPAFNGTPSMANALASPPAPTQQGAMTPETLALLQSMPAAQGTSALLSMQQDALKQARTPPVPQSFYDDQGREYKATYDPATQSWKKVGGSKSDLPAGMRMGANGPEPIPGYLDMQKQIRAAGKPDAVTNITVGAESAMQKELGGLIGKDLMGARANAEAAIKQLQIAPMARELLDKGVITGTGATFKQAAAKALSGAGLISGESVANTEAFMATMGKQTLELVKNLGAGSGISNADREYAEKIAGGNIELSEAGLRKILDLNERAARATVAGYKSRLKPVLEDKTTPESFRSYLQSGLDMPASSTAGFSIRRLP